MYVSTDPTKPYVYIGPWSAPHINKIYINIKDKHRASSMFSSSSDFLHYILRISLKFPRRIASDVDQHYAVFTKSLFSMRKKCSRYQLLHDCLFARQGNRIDDSPTISEKVEKLII